MNALKQMTTYKMLNVLPIREDAFLRGLSYEIGLYLFSKYSIFTDGMVLQINSILGGVRFSPEDKIQVVDWLEKSPISEALKYANLLKFKL